MNYTKKKRPGGTQLKFVKVEDINVVPRYLFEQVKPDVYDVEKLYEWAPVLLNNPMNLMGVFVDKKESVKGVMWCTFNPITDTINVNTLSIDRSYWGMGIIDEANGILDKFKKKLGASKIACVTSRPNALISKGGFNTSNLVLLER